MRKQTRTVPYPFGKTTEQRSERLFALDGLRCIAILAVFGNHAASRVVPGGMLGVSIFFALSGYLITSILLVEYRESGKIRIRRFLFRRTLRLAPALLVAAAILVIPAYYLGYAHPFGDSISAITYTSNFYSAYEGVERGTIGHSWSLSVEQQFYLLWPPLLAVLAGAKRQSFPLLVTFGIFIALTSVTFVAILAGAQLSVLYLLPTTRLPEILVGCILAILLDSRHATRILNLARPVWLPMAALVGLCASIFLFDLYNNRFMYIGGYSLAGIATCITIAHVVANRDSIIAQVLSVKWAVWLGTISYSFYLWHYVAIVLPKLVLPVAPAIIVGFFLATGLAYTSYRLIEVPFHNLRHSGSEITLFSRSR